MRKVALLVVALLCLSVMLYAGEVITNDTGEDATGFQVLFSAPVQITAFGDTLMQVDQTGAATEFVFSGGTVSPWGSHWMSWTPAAASILNHEWLHGGEQGIRKSTLELPSTTVTHFPPSVALQMTDTVSKFQPIDGFNEGSTVPVERWYFFSSDGGGILTPTPGATDPVVTYVYSDDNSSGCAVEYQQPIDLSSYKGLRIVASADHPVDMEVVVGICDDTISKEGDEACGESAALFSRNLSLTQERQEFLLPFDQFKIHPYILENHPTADLTPNFSGVFDITFHPFGFSGVVEIKEVSVVSQVAPRQVAWVKINDYYFKQPAYVMQGVGDTNAIYALPLKGIPELGTGYVAEDASGGELTWSVTTSDPGIGAGFQDETLYIWGADAKWSGYGEAVLTVIDSDGMSDSIVVPVTVFRDDKTLINPEGKKDYFVPWAPELDINRILSVEEHMRKYEKEDAGLLDRTICFSAWRLMERLNDATKSARWDNEARSGGWWNQEAQFRLVTMFLEEIQRIGFNAIRITNSFFVRGYRGSTLYPAFDMGITTMTEEEEAYLINEAHRLGLKVLASEWIGVDMRSVNGVYVEIWQVCPKDLDAFWKSYGKLMRGALSVWTKLGVDIAAIGEGVEVVCAQSSTENFIRSKEELHDLARTATKYYPGPLTYFAAEIYGPPYDWDRWSIWQDLDILCATPRVTPHTPLTESPDPTYEELVAGWERVIEEVFEPFQKRWNKPFLAREVGCFSVSGASRLGAYYQLEHRDLVVPGRLDLEEQVRFYRSFFEATSDYDALFGFGAYRYEFNHYNIGGVNDLSWVPRLKPVEAVFEVEFRGSVTPHRITLDGRNTEWDEEDLLVVDDPSDSETGRDEIRKLFAREDDGYLYFLIEYADKPNGNMSIELDWTGDMVADCFITTTWLRSPACWNSFVGLAGEAQPICVADAASGEDGMEIRVNKKILKLPDGPYSVRISDSSWNWSKLDDETDWGCFPEIDCSLRSAFMRTEHGYLTKEISQVIDGVNSVVGRSDGSAKYTPYLWTDPSTLQLMPNHSYRVCFDYRIIESHPEGFEVLYFSPTGARDGNWVTSLLVKGPSGNSGHVCLEGQLHDYWDYEIRWNVISSGEIVIDNVVVRDLKTNEVITEEDFEEWK